MNEKLSFSSHLIRALAAAFGLGGMLLSSALVFPALSSSGPGVALTMLALTGLFVALYGWAENIRERPLFWLVPGIWIGFALVLGLGTKGEGLILGLPLVLMVSLFVRNHYRRSDSRQGLSSE